MAKVKVYSTESCPWCHRVKDFLKEKKIEFEEVDVSKDQEAYQEIYKKSGQMGVPQIEIDGEIIVGFDQEKIEKALKIN
jgi:glutaredoxin 3